MCARRSRRQRSTPSLRRLSASPRSIASCSRTRCPGVRSAIAAGMACVAITNDLTRDAMRAAKAVAGRARGGRSRTVGCGGARRARRACEGQRCRVARKIAIHGIRRAKMAMPAQAHDQALRMGSRSSRPARSRISRPAPHGGGASFRRRSAPADAARLRSGSARLVHLERDRRRLRVRAPEAEGRGLHPVASLHLLQRARHRAHVSMRTAARSFATG